MRVAIEGCMHGELTKVYDTIKEIETREGYKIDLLLCCGDFQSVRNFSDLKSMAVPDKYKEIGTFYKYYSGEVLAPVLTIFIGGNHEASNYLQELPFGGWVAPNIYYLGYAGVIQVNDILIGGLSGIYKGLDYLKGRHEIPPYSHSTIRSVYHIRNVDVFRLKQLGRTPDIFLSHDWPRGIHNFGDVHELLRRKKFFHEDIAKNELGSRPTMELLSTLKPSYWFSAHLHVKFPAILDHDDGSSTKFLALDKCLPNRQFLQILSIGAECGGSNLTIKFCPEWLAILRSTNHLVSIESKDNHMPGPRYDGRFNFSPTPEELEEIASILEGNFEIPQNFKTNTDVFDPNNDSNYAFRNAPEPRPISNSQTKWLCQKFGISDPVELIMGKGTREDFFTSSFESTMISTPNTVDSFNKDEIQLDDDDDDTCDNFHLREQNSRTVLSLPSPQKTNDPEDEGTISEKLRFDDEDCKTFVIDTEGKIDDRVGDTSPKKKVLKRRNQSLYAEAQE